jgi:hypothetical protein
MMLCLVLLVAVVSGCGRLRDVHQRDVSFLRDPEVMHEHSELARDSYGSSLPRVLPAAGCDRFTVPSQIAVGTEGTENVVTALHE